MPKKIASLAMDLADRLVLVSGASSGIGAEIAREMASRGARLVLVARGRERLEALAAELREGGARVEARPADLGDFEQVASLGAALLDQTGPPDVLVNNAGAGRWRAVDENEPGEALQQIALPYLAAFELTRALLPAMIARGSGRIVNMTSGAALFAFPGAAGYGTARWAMVGFNEHLREDLRDTGVGVTLVCPAEVDSPYFDNNPGSRERVPRAGVLFGTATPEQVARRVGRGIERDRARVWVPRRLGAMAALTRHFPRSSQLLVSRTGWRRQG
jgi:short-subunit dehydrogenase